MEDDSFHFSLEDVGIVLNVFSFQYGSREVQCLWLPCLCATPSLEGVTMDSNILLGFPVGVGTLARCCLLAISTGAVLGDPPCG